MWQSIKISVLFDKSTHQTLPFWLKLISGKFPSFPEKLTLYAKLVQNMVMLGFWTVTPWLCDNQSKFKSYSTNLHTKDYHSDQKEFLENFPVFQKNLQCVQNWDKNGFAFILKCYHLIMWQSISILVLFHKFSYQTLLFWLKIISGKFPSFPEKLTLCANLLQKWSCWNFELLPFDYVTIHQNLSPNPHIYILTTTILTKKIFWKISQFSRKTYIVCKIGTKMVLQGFWSVTPWLCDNPSKSQS